MLSRCIVGKKKSCLFFICLNKTDLRTTEMTTTKATKNSETVIGHLCKFSKAIIPYRLLKWKLLLSIDIWPYHYDNEDYLMLLLCTVVL